MRLVAGIVLALSAFAELAGGGVRSFPRGLRVHRVNRTRRGARRLFNACREPVTLADLARAEVRIWPGLLLAALAEAIEPTWTLAHSFTIAFSIEGLEEALLAVSVNAGLPVAVARLHDEHPVDGLALPATVSLSERAFLLMLAGEPLPADEQIRLEGEAEPLERLLAWTDRVQGIRRSQTLRSWPPPRAPKQALRGRPTNGGSRLPGDASPRASITPVPGPSIVAVAQQAIRRASGA